MFNWARLESIVLKRISTVDERKVMFNSGALLVLKYNRLKRVMCQCTPAEECLSLCLIIERFHFRDLLFSTCLNSVTELNAIFAILRGSAESNMIRIC